MLGTIIDCDLGSDASGCIAQLVSQQKLGPRPERRVGIGGRNPARPAAHGTPPILIETGCENNLTRRRYHREW